MAFWDRWKKKPEETAEAAPAEDVAEEVVAEGSAEDVAEEAAAEGSAEENAEEATAEDSAEEAAAEYSTDETTEQPVAEIPAEEPQIEENIIEDSSVEELPEVELQDDAKPVKKGFFARLVEGLTKTRNSIASSFDSLFTASEIDDDFYEDLEEILIMSDIGVHTTMNIIEDVQAKVKEQHIKIAADCRALLKESIMEQMSSEPAAYEFENTQSVVLVIGVNGVGKTTTIGKLASKLKAQNKKVVMAAADTFRAAATEQLKEWAHRAGADIISGQEGADPASVVYDACQSAKSKNADVLLVDTAGRLHNKKNLMEELRKINRILDREFPDAHRETLIVVDAATGQNALNQARDFNEVAPATGVVLTKMDGTAKGGIAIAIQSELGIPVKYIGVGEAIDDLQKFDSESFVNAIFD